MGLEVAHFVQVGHAESREFAEVSEVASRLARILSEPTLAAALVAANQPARSSAVVQAVLTEAAAQLGFVSEKKGLFHEYPTPALRPDFFRPVGDNGIILEVERGKTTINNMDLLDFWKCHLCAAASHLFLAVPQELRQNDLMAPRREYVTVVKRLSTFFEPRNYTNVRSLFIFGY
jgi:hypothetical protein